MVPKLTVPVSGSSSPNNIFNKVLLPTPLGPKMPIRSPRIIFVVNDLTIVLSPKDFDMPSASMTTLPDDSPLSTCNFTLPTLFNRSERSLRNCSNARTRPSLRVRRALMPWRIQTSSCANFLSNNAFCCSSITARSSLFLI